MGEVWYCPEINELFIVTEVYKKELTTNGLQIVSLFSYYGSHLTFSPEYESLLVFDNRWKKKCVFLGGV